MLIAVDKILDDKIVLLGSRSSIGFGNSSAEAYANAYLPWFELISIVLFDSTTNVRGCSGNVFNVSSNSFAGTAIWPSLSLSTSINVDIVLSRSLAETIRLVFLRSNKKLSRMGRVLELFITPPKTCNCFCKYVLDTMNFIRY